MRLRVDISTISIDRKTTLGQAKICRHVYNGKGDLPNEWRVYKKKINGMIKEDESIGFRCEIYQNGDKYILAFAGTQSKEGAVQDILQLVGCSDAYQTAADVAQTVAEQLGTKNLTFVGHSLGGGLAQIAALATGAPAVTFNTAWLSTATKLLRSSNFPARITNFVILGEFLDLCQRTPKLLYIFSKLGVISCPFADKLLPVSRNLSPIGDFVHIFYVRAFCSPMGIFTAHGIDYVIEALENDALCLKFSMGVYDSMNEALRSDLSLPNFKERFFGSLIETSSKTSPSDSSSDSADEDRPTFRPVFAMRSEFKNWNNSTENKEKAINQMFLARNAESNALQRTSLARNVESNAKSVTGAILRGASLSLERSAESNALQRMLFERSAESNAKSVTGAILRGASLSLERSAESNLLQRMLFERSAESNVPQRMYDSFRIERFTSFNNNNDNNNSVAALIGNCFQEKQFFSSPHREPEHRAGA